MKITVCFIFWSLMFFTILSGQSTILDTTFKYRIFYSLPVNTIKIQKDKKIIIGGAFRALGPLGTSYIDRINPDGTKDESFLSGMGFDGPVNDIQIQEDGKILVGGIFRNYNSTIVINLVRLNNDATLDQTFRPHQSALGGADGVKSISLYPDGKLIVCTPFTVYKLNANGSIDGNFKFHSISNFDGIIAKSAIQKD